MTKQELLNSLDNLKAENHQLKQENEMFRQTLLNFYSKSRSALGIEAATAQREKTYSNLLDFYKLNKNKPIKFMENNEMQTGILIGLLHEGTFIVNQNGNAVDVNPDQIYNL